MYPPRLRRCCCHISSTGSTRWTLLGGLGTSRRRLRRPHVEQFEGELLAGLEALGLELERLLDERVDARQRLDRRQPRRRLADLGVGGGGVTVHGDDLRLHGGDRLVDRLGGGAERFGEGVHGAEPFV